MIHWLHLSDADVSKAHRIIEAFKEDDTIDALGFQRISACFDDWFYPAVTTPMTRARYYLFIPAIYAQLERKRLGYRATLEEAKERQHDLRKRLLDTEGAGRGVIGEKKGKNLQRLPSAVYWSSLTDLGILAKHKDGRSLSEAQYQRMAAAMPSDDKVHADEGDDDDPAPVSPWDRHLPRDGILDRAGRFRSPLGFRVTETEANYLLEKLEKLPGSAESLLGFRLRSGLAGPYEYAWDVLREKYLPTRLRTRLEHARSFSAFARGLSLVYYAMVIDEKKRWKLPFRDREETLAKLREEFRFWCMHGRRLVRRWDLDAFQAGLPADRFSRSDFNDFKRTLALLLKGADAHRVLNSNALRELIRKRERAKRRMKCRLCGRREHRRYLEQWDGPPNRWQDAFHLTYRHGPGDTIVRDLLRQPYRRHRDLQN